MQQLLQKLQSIKKEKLTAFKPELAEQEAQELQELSTQVEQLRADIERQVKTAQIQKESKGAHQAEIDMRFALDSYKQELLRLFWKDITDQHFSKKDVHTSWVQNQLDAALDTLESDAESLNGVIEAGLSYDQLKKAKLPKGITLKKSGAQSDVADEPGFVLTTDSKIIDARLSTYLEEQFTQNKSDLYQVAFK